MRQKPDICDLRRKSAFLRGLAEIRQVQATNGAGTSGRLLEVRTPAGLHADIALDRGGDLFRVNWRGNELGWHGATGAPVPSPAPDIENGLGTLRGFDGFLVTCGLDHHGVASRLPADDFNYPLRRDTHHPLHGRIATCRADLKQAHIDWNDAEAIIIRLTVVQAAIFGEVLELERTYRFNLFDGRIVIDDEVRNMGYRPTRHGILYHFNIGYPLLDSGSRLIGNNWEFRDRLDGDGAKPTDDHVEIVEAGRTPLQAGDRARIGITNPAIGATLSLSYDGAALPVTAIWRAFQSGVFALGLEPQTDLTGEVGGAPTLAAGEARNYAVEIDIVET